MNKPVYQNTKLGSYLVNRGESAYSFAKYSHVSIMTVYKILHGHPIRKDVAKKVQRATKKFVTLEDFGYGD